MNLVSMSPPKTKRGERTFNRLLESAESCFAASGYAGTSVEEITKNANIALGTFYVYFSDKLSLYHYVVEKHVSVLVNGLQENQQAGFLDAVRNVATYAKTHPNAFLVLRELFTVDRQVHREYISRLRRAWEPCIAAISQNEKDRLSYYFAVTVLHGIIEDEIIGWSEVSWEIDDIVLAVQQAISVKQFG